MNALISRIGTLARLRMRCIHTVTDVVARVCEIGNGCTGNYLQLHNTAYSLYECRNIAASLFVNLLYQNPPHLTISYTFG